MRIRQRALAASAAAACVFAAGCSDGGDGGSSAPTVTETVTASPSSGAPSAPASTSGGATAPSSPSGAGCAPTGGGAPAGAASRETVDVDGDGRRDTVWLSTADAPARFGVTTASGATFEAPVSFAGGSQPDALVADVTGDGSQIVGLVTNGRAVLLLRALDCAWDQVRDAQGQPYVFDLGFTGFGTGVGCVDATGDGVRDLVGLNVVRDGAGATTSVTRTVIELQGATASNGPTSDVPPTPEAVASAQTVTCGELTLQKDGLTA